MAHGEKLPQAFDPGGRSSGYLISAAEDLAHYLIALLNGGQYGDRAIARPATLLIPELKRGLVVLVNQNGMLGPLLDPNPPWMGVAHRMLGNAGPPPPAQTWRVLPFALVVAMDLGIGLLRIWRLPRWSRKPAGRSRAALWTLAMISAISA